MNQLVEIAKAEIGYEEHPAGSNKTKYGVWFGLNGVPWCAIFVSWCYDKAGMPLGNIGFSKGMAGTQTGLAHFRKLGKVTKNPVPGDIVFFDWKLDGCVKHVGIYVNKIDDVFFESIEGNTGTGNDSNGGMVMLRKRHIKNAIFVHV